MGPSGKSLAAGAVIADVTYGPAHNNLGQLYLMQGKLYLAAWEFEYAQKLMPERPEPYYNLGMVFEQADRFDEAIQYYSAAHDMAPENPRFIGNLARAMLKKDDLAPGVSPLLSDLILCDSARLGPLGQEGSLPASLP